MGSEFVRRGTFRVNDHAFEVMVDVGGTWDRMVHIVDLESTHPQTDPEGIQRLVPDVVITGAKWDGNKIVVKPEDVVRDDWERLIEPATAIVAKLMGN